MFLEKSSQQPCNISPEIWPRTTISSPKDNKDTQNNRTLFLCSEKHTRLGNAIFIYATLYGIAKLYDMKVLLDRQAHIVDIFPHLDAHMVDDKSDLCNNFALIEEFRPSSTSKHLFHLAANKSYQIDGYLQSWKHFAHVQEDLKRQLVFSDDILRTARGIVNEKLSRVTYHKTNPLTLVGVHVRRGDLTSAKMKARGVRAAPLDYFQNAMYAMKSEFSNVVFIICTDDKQWVKNNFFGENMFLVEEQNLAAVDMAILSLCNHTIMSVGTFGWWSAWLAGGITMYYSYPAERDSHFWYIFGHHGPSSEFYPPRWISLP